MKNSHQSGFTLVEILVTVVILGILGVLIVQTFITTISSNIKTELIKDIKQNGDFAVDLISRKIRNAKSMDCSDEHEILVINQDGTQSEYYAAENGTICRMAQLDNPGNILTYITSNNLNLNASGGICAEKFIVEDCSRIASQDAKVTFSFVLSQEKSPSQTKYYEKASQAFKTTVSLRNIQY